MKKTAKLILPALLLSVLLTGCKSASSTPSPNYSSEVAAIPELPAAARLGETLPICSPTCTEKLTQQRETMQQKLTGAGGLP